VRTKLLAVVAVIALASAFVVVATARTTANGLPSYTDGWQKWPRINQQPFRDRGPLSSAHSGLKNVYASKRKRAGRYPNGTVVVKTIVKPGTRFVGQFAVMRKLRGRWTFVEYERSSARARYTVLARGQLCVDCHVMARRTDYVFTQR
jgi:Cytochrome P460